MNGTLQMLTVNHMVSWGFRLQAHLAQRVTTLLGWSPRAAPHLYHGRGAGSWTGDPTAHQDLMMGEGRQPQTMSVLPREAPGQRDIVFSCSHFFPVPHFCFIPFFCFVLLPECTSGVPCHGNTCRWRQSSSSTSFASAEEVTNHFTSEVLSPRYPWTICKRGCPWSTGFSQVFSSLLQTSGKALFPLPASHHVPCSCHFTASCKLPA